MPDPPAIPGFTWDPDRKKYFRTVNGALQGSTQKYHNNSVQSQKRKQRALDTCRKDDPTKTDIQQAPWSASLCQLMLGRLQGFKGVQFNLLQSIKLNAYTTCVKQYPQGQWLCSWSPDYKVIYAESSQVNVPGHLLIDDQEVHNAKLNEYLARKQAVGVTNHELEVEVLPLIPIIEDNWIWWCVPVSFHGDLSYFPMIFHRQVDLTESLLRAVCQIAAKYPRHSKMLSSLFGLDRTVLSASTNIPEIVTRINFLLKVTHGKGNVEMFQLMRQLDPGDGYWYADPLTSIRKRCNLGNVKVHICRHHLIVHCSMGGLSIPLREAQFNVDGAEVWSAKSQVVGIGCNQGRPFFVTKFGKLEPGPQLSANLVRVWSFARWNIVETNTHQLLRVNDDGSVVDLGPNLYDNNPYLQLANVGNYLVIGGKDSFTVIDVTSGARASGTLPETPMPLKRLIPLSNGLVIFSYPGCTTVVKT